jgi:hypothetical protein
MMCKVRWTERHAQKHHVDVFILRPVFGTYRTRTLEGSEYPDQYRLVVAILDTETNAAAT